MKIRNMLWVVLLVTLVLTSAFAGEYADKLKKRKDLVFTEYDIKNDFKNIFDDCIRVGVENIASPGIQSDLRYAMDLAETDEDSLSSFWDRVYNNFEEAVMRRFNKIT